MKRIPIGRFLPFVFYSVLIALCAGCAATTGTHSLVSGLFLVALGFLIWNPAEYAIHRFAFHFDARSERGKQWVYDSHLVHHEKPNTLDDIFSNISTSFPPTVVFFLVSWAVSGRWQSAVFVTSGLILGYFLYEFLHWQAHHLSSRNRVLMYLRKYHMLHHHQSPKLRFGVTSPLFDLVFGTYGPIGKASRSTR